jgi:hypothetical protein
VGYYPPKRTQRSTTLLDDVYIEDKEGGDRKIRLLRVSWDRPRRIFECCWHEDWEYFGDLRSNVVPVITGRANLSVTKTLPQMKFLAYSQESSRDHQSRAQQAIFVNNWHLRYSEISLEEDSSRTRA